MDNSRLDSAMLDDIPFSSLAVDVRDVSKDQASRARAVWRAGRPHHCGLLHRSDCTDWSLMAAFLWWLLR
jgi:hypothetical protein